MFQFSSSGWGGHGGGGGGDGGGEGGGRLGGSVPHPMIFFENLAH